MIDCVYTKTMSSVSFDAEKKRLLLQNMYENLEPAKKERKATLAKRSIWISAVSAVCVVAIVCALVFGVFGYQIAHRFRVNDPISQEDYLHISDTARNAQYLPNLMLMSGGNEGQIAAGNALLAGESGDGNSADDFYDQCDISVDDSELDFGIEDYRKVSDALGYIDSPLHEGAATVNEIKDEIIFILDFIPGYDQWYRLPYNLPHIIDKHKYSDYLYKLSYDKPSETISMTRILWNTTVSVYDSATRKVYSSYADDDCYQAEMLEVIYTHDSQGREVVKCVNTYYFVLNGNYYPISRQYLVNVKDTSATKIYVYFTMSNELKEEYYGLDNSLQNNPTSRVYDIRDIHDEGIFVKGIQLDYTGNDNINLLKFDKWYPSMYSSVPVTTNMAFYSKQGDDTAFYTDSWDYYDEENSKGYTDFENAYDFSNYVEEVDGTTTLSMGAVKKIFATDISKYYQKGYCKYCEMHDYPYSDFVRSCGHIVSGEEISRHDKWCVYNASNTTFDEPFVRQKIISQLKSMYSVIGLTSRPFDTYEENSLYGFEYAFDEYTSNLSADYLKAYYDFDEVVSTITNAEKTFSAITEEYVEEIMLGRANFLYGIKSKTVYKNSVLEYDFTVKLSVNPDLVERGKDYYLALYYAEISGRYISAIVVDTVKIDMTQTQLSMQGKTTYDEIQKHITDYSVLGGGFSGDLVVGIISYDSMGKVVIETPCVELPVVSSDRYETEKIYRQGAIRIRLTYRVNKNVYVYIIPEYAS